MVRRFGILTVPSTVVTDERPNDAMDPFDENAIWVGQTFTRRRPASSAMDRCIDVAYTDSGMVEVPYVSACGTNYHSVVIACQAVEAASTARPAFARER